MNLQEIKDKFNRGRMDITEIEWLIQTLDKRNKELAGALEREASYIDDIEQMDAMLEQANFKINSLEAINKELNSYSRINKYLSMAAENLRMSQELAELKGVIPVGNQSR